MLIFVNDDYHTCLRRQGPTGKLCKLKESPFQGKTYKIRNYTDPLEAVYITELKENVTIVEVSRQLQTQMIYDLSSIFGSFS